jgi:hypothetical protein
MRGTPLVWRYASLTHGHRLMTALSITFNTEMFSTRSIFILLSLFPCAAQAQRPTATFLGGSLVRLELDGFRVFADAPLTHDGVGLEDVALYSVDPPSPPPGGRVFTPSYSGEVLDRRTERLAERTGIYVYPRPTPLGDTAHYSYLVQWNGRRIYFTGDTRDPKDLLEVSEVDVAFVTPALLKAVEKAHRSISARTVVVYHTGDLDAAGDPVHVPCDQCKVVVPRTGDVIQLFR